MNGCRRRSKYRRAAIGGHRRAIGRRPSYRILDGDHAWARIVCGARLRDPPVVRSGPAGARPEDGEHAG
jgi:hypothetical protein